jgi:hypothetical protein
MQSAAQRVIVGNESLDLATPMSQHEFLPWAVPDLDRGAVARDAACRGGGDWERALL